jgi:hypothetical protein
MVSRRIPIEPEPFHQMCGGITELAHDLLTHHITQSRANKKGSRAIARGHMADACDQESRGAPGVWGLQNVYGKLGGKS